MSSKLPILYKQDKRDGIRSWQVWTEEDNILTSFGSLNGQEQIASKRAEPKNVGQKNATTGEQQAILEATSMWKKQKDKGYRTSIEEAREYILLPMLANKFEDHKHKIKYPVNIQPKLDGVRCLAYWGTGGVELMSRKGKSYNVPHIKEQLEAILPTGRVFDGELYLHGTTLQQVNRLVKKLRPETIEIEYWIYDSFEFNREDTPWSIREEYLGEELQFVCCETKNIRVVETCIVFSEKEVYETQKEFVATGFEGAIVRCLDAPYEVGHRSNFLLKVKSFQDAEFKVIGFKDGVGKDVGCVIWICELPNKETFGAKPKGTRQQKQKWYSEASLYLGKWLTVKYFDLSEDGIPTFPVGLDFRLEEDLPDDLEEQ
jgi:DNA ligase-1